MNDIMMLSQVGRKSDLFDNIDWNNYIRKFNPSQANLFEFMKDEIEESKSDKIYGKARRGRCKFLKKQIRVAKRVSHNLKTTTEVENGN